MTLPLAIGIVGAAVVAGVNAVTTRALWRSPIFERPQKAAQTVLIWVIPGTFVVVRHLLGELTRRHVESDDPTISRRHGFEDDPSAYTHGPGGGGDHL